MSGYPPVDRERLPGFDALCEHAYRAHGVQLLGSLGEGDPDQEEPRATFRALPAHGGLRGLIGVCEDFGRIRALAVDVAEARVPHPSSAAGSGSGKSGPRWALPERAAGVRRLLLCSFRESSVVLLEQVARHAAELEVTVLLPTREELEAARGELLSGSPRGLSRRRVAFRELAPGSFRIDRESGQPIGQIRRVAGDWTLGADLERHALDNDAIVVTSDSEEPDPDARTVTGLLKLAHLIGRESARVRPGLRVMGALRDAVKAQLLERRFAEIGQRPGGAAVTVDLVSRDRLRNDFVAQNVMVPGITGVLGELLSQGGDQLAWMVPDGDIPAGSGTFLELTQALRDRGQGIPIAIEFGHADGHLIVNPGNRSEAAAFDWKDLRAIAIAGRVL